MMPIAKKRGSTVFGVRIGLVQRRQYPMESILLQVHQRYSLPGLESLLPERGICDAHIC